MLSTLPTYPNYENFPSLLQGMGLPYIFQLTDLKIPEFLHTIADGQALTVTSGTLIEIDLNVLKTFKEYAILQETSIALTQILINAGTDYLQVYGFKVGDILTDKKTYTIKVIMSDASEFYTDIFSYCSENQI